MVAFFSLLVSGIAALIAVIGWATGVWSRLVRWVARRRRPAASVDDDGADWGV